jgi:hypothetical protein
MSGGSFNYLYQSVYSGWDAIIQQEGDISDMAQDLAGLGYAEDAARETEELLLIIRQAKVRIETRAERLREVWKAVEWWRSCDWGENDVKEALAKYREDAPE